MKLINNMKLLSFVSFHMLCSTFVPATCISELLFVNGKYYYISENKTNHVTSQEICLLRAGRLVHVDNLRVPSFLKALNLSAKTSYWLDGSVPIYIKTPSCLLLSRTIMTVRCDRLHYFICEIDSSSLSHTVSPTRSKDYVTTHSHSNNVDLLSPSSGVSQHPTSHVYRPKTSTTAFGLNTKATAYKHNETFSSSFFGLIRSPGPISPTVIHNPVSEAKTFVGLISKTSVTSLTPSGERVQNTSPGNLSVMCYRYCLSQNFSKPLQVAQNISKQLPEESGLLNDSLKVNLKQTSKAIRKLTSAWDSRASSKTIGGVAIAIIIAVPVCIILMDLPLLIRNFSCIISK